MRLVMLRSLGNQSAVHDKGITVKDSSTIGIAQYCPRRSRATMPFDDDRSRSGMDSDGCQFRIVISAPANIRGCVDMHINDVVQ